MHSKNIVIGVLLLVLISAVGYLLLNSDDKVVETGIDVDTEEMIPVEENEGIGDGAESIDQVQEEERGAESNIGTSVSGKDITAYHFGTGDTELLFVGGIHGGYSWNTSLLAYELIDYLETNPSEVPSNVTITIIPVANPDGLNSTVGTDGRFDAAKALALSDAVKVAGRFNDNDVDLNRNFDCEWEAEGVWQSREVSGGASAFSEPEAIAIRDYVKTYNPAAAIVWFSAEGKVYPSACAGTPSDESVELAASYAAAAGYPAEAEFDAYAITGDMVNWMAKEGVPAISVLLTNHENTEWSKNLAGVQAVIKAYAE